MSNNIIKYTAASAMQNAVDTFDSDNFYPFDGDFDGVVEDIEFSNGSGKLKEGLGKIGSAFKSGGSKLKGAVEKHREGKDERQADRDKRQGKRKERRVKRRDARQINKSREVLTNSVVSKNVDLIQAKNPVVEKPVEAIKEGEASPVEEKIADKVFETAVEMTKTGTTEAPNLKVNLTTGEVQKAESGWKGLSTIAKVGIIGGGILTISLVVFAIIKSRK